MATLSQITTQWTVMENIKAENGLRALAEYLAANYFEAIATSFQRKRSQLSDLDAHELAADVLFEFIKDNYRSLDKLSRDRGSLRALLRTIIKRKLSKLEQKKIHSPLEEDMADEENSFGEVLIYLVEVLEKMQREKPGFDKIFIKYHLQQKDIEQICREHELSLATVYRRLQEAREFVEENLRDLPNK